MMNYWESYGNIKEKKWGGGTILLRLEPQQGHYIYLKKFKAYINKFFSFQFCDVVINNINNHSQKDLVKFGSRFKTKQVKFEILMYFGNLLKPIV